MATADGLAQAATSEEDGRNRLHFRVLSIDGARRAFRLEMIYWDALGVLAAHNGRTVAGEVQARLLNAPSDLNQSSLLRASVTADLLGAWTEAESRAVKPDWSAMIAALPAPAFLVSRRSVLLAVNEPLLTALQGLRAEPGVPLNSIEGALSLKVQLPPSAIAQLAPGQNRKFVICTASFSAHGQRIACHVRLTPVQGAQLEAAHLLGFLEAGRG